MLDKGARSLDLFRGMDACAACGAAFVGFRRAPPRATCGQSFFAKGAQSVAAASSSRAYTPWAQMRARRWRRRSRCRITGSTTRPPALHFARPIRLERALYPEARAG